MSMIYLDYNATTPTRPEVIDLMTSLLPLPLNASSVHAMGRKGKSQIETARLQVAKLLNAQQNQVVFNSGATEGNNTVLKHFARSFPVERILVSAIEHPSVLQAVPSPGHIPVSKEGIIDLNTLEDMLKNGGKTSLVSVMAANNETGAIQPIKEAVTLAHSHGALFHCDAVQAAGRIELDINEIGADFITLSAHKLGGPQGIGALIFGGCGITPVLLDGGGQEKKARAGTENVSAIAGFGLAAKIALNELSSYQEKQRKLRILLEQTLTSLAKDTAIFAYDTPRLSNTTMLAIEGMRAESLLMGLDLAGFYVSNGSACSSGTVQPSHVLKAMNIDADKIAGAIRISTGYQTSKDDITTLGNALKTLINHSA